MPLPVRTALADIEAICRYLLARPEGATPAVMAAALGDIFDLRKLFALKFWGLVADDGTTTRLTARGRRAVHDGGIHRASALQEVVATIPPYAAVIARAVAGGEPAMLASDVAAHWQQHFKSECQFGILNHQTVCFFRIAEGAGLGRLMVGRKGQQTRFELAERRPAAFVDSTAAAAPPASAPSSRVARDSADGGASPASRHSQSGSGGSSSRTAAARRSSSRSRSSSPSASSSRWSRRSVTPRRGRSSTSSWTRCADATRR